MDQDQGSGFSQVPLAGRIRRFSVSQSKVTAVEAYIAEQKSITAEGHSRLVQFLRKHGDEYDERYIWR
jgi:hypothetical protein